MPISNHEYEDLEHFLLICDCLKSTRMKLVGLQCPHYEDHEITISGVVGRERMGTAFPHNRLSGNCVPTREFLRDIFSLLLLNYSYFPLLPFTCRQKT